MKKFNYLLMNLNILVLICTNLFAMEKNTNSALYDAVKENNPEKVLSCLENTNIINPQDLECFLYKAINLRNELNNEIALDSAEIGRASSRLQTLKYELKKNDLIIKMLESTRTSLSDEAEID